MFSLTDTGEDDEELTVTLPQNIGEDTDYEAGDEITVTNDDQEVATYPLNEDDIDALDASDGGNHDVTVDISSYFDDVEEDMEENMTFTAAASDGINVSDGTDIADDVHVDTLAPTASVTSTDTDTIGEAPGNSFDVQSTESGTAYVAPHGSYADVANLAAADIGNVTINEANKDTSLTLDNTAMADAGTYELYTVDGNGNISDAADQDIVVNEAIALTKVEYSNKSFTIATNYDLDLSSADGETEDIKHAESSSVLDVFGINGLKLKTSKDFDTDGDEVTLQYDESFNNFTVSATGAPSSGTSGFIDLKITDTNNDVSQTITLFQNAYGLVSVE